MNFNNSQNQKTFAFESNKEYEELSFNEEEWGKPIMEMIQQNYDLHPINFLYDSHTVEYKLSNPIEQLKTDNCNNNTINICTNFDGNKYFFKFPSFRPLESQNEICNKIVSNQPKEDYCTCANLELLNSTETSLKFQSTNDNLKITKEQELNRESISSPQFEIFKLNNSSNFKSWGRKQDIILFKLLRDTLINFKIDIEEFLIVDSDDVLDHRTRTIKNNFYEDIIERIYKVIGWKRTPYDLLKRMLKLSKNQTFSVRDERFLINLKRNRKFSKLNISKLHENFPGKRIVVLKEKLNSL